MGLRRDEAAPTTVPAEVLQMIGPSPAVRRLEAKLEIFRRSLAEKFGKPSRAKGEEGRQLKRVENELRSAKQTHTRKIVEKLRHQYFQTKDDEQLEKHLLGDILASPALQTAAEPQITYAEPTRKRVAEILSDLDEDLSEEEVVKRKVDAIRAWVAHAFVRETRTRVSKSGTPALPSPQVHSESGQPLLKAVPFPPNQVISKQHISQKSSLRTEGISQADVAVADCIVCIPPPPYSETDNSGWSASSTADLKTPSRSASAKPSPIPCIFCGKKYKRNSTMWDHVEDHLRHAIDGRVPCPVQECKKQGLICDGIMNFKSHASRVHNVKLRPKVVLHYSGKVS